MNATLYGTICKPPLLRETSKGHVLNIRIEETIGGKQSWTTAAIWDPMATVLSQVLQEGMTVEVTGRPTVRSWTGDDGQQRTELQVNASAVGWREPREGGSQVPTPTNAAHRPTTTPQPAPAQVADEEADPFGDQ